MKRLLPFLLCALPLWCTGQPPVLFYNDNAIVTVQAGATLTIQGSLQNTAGGTIDNKGTIDLEGNLVNAGTWTNTDPNTLKFSGTGNSDVTSGSAQFRTVQVNKGTGANVNLLSNMTVNTLLDFNGTNNRLNLGNFDLKLGSTATVTGYNSTEFIAHTGTGMVEKAVTANGTFEFPVGDGTNNYSPITAVYTGSSYTAANLRVRVNDLTHPNKPADATDYISRYWDVDATGIGGYSNTLTGTYIPGDLTGTGSLVKGASYDGANWSYAGAAAGTNTVTGVVTANSTDFTGTNFFGKAILKVFLAGALPGSGNPPMNTTLNNAPSLIPLGSPYSAAPWNAPAVSATSIPAGTTDWILVETRDPSINIISQTSAFLKNDGTIVGIDGGPLLLKNAIPSAIISIRHRNHLGVRTINALDLVNPTLHDFSTGTGQAWTNPSITTNANMRLIGPTYCLWGGNANITNATALTRISYIGAANDPQAVLNAMGGNSGVPVLGVYSIADVNMNRNITYIGAANDPQTILQNMSGNSGVPVLQHLQ